MLRVLIVDDDQNFRYAIRTAIPWEEYGFQVTGEAKHGQQALEILQKESVQLVLTDMEMPLMNGVELTRQIRLLYPDIVVVALSAFDDISFVRESMKLGAADYILKQEFEPEKTAHQLQELCKNSSTSGRQELTREQSRDEVFQYLQGSTCHISEQNLYHSRLAQKNLSVCLVEVGAGETIPPDIDQMVPDEVRFLLSMRYSIRRWFFVLQLTGSTQGQAGVQTWNSVVNQVRRLYTRPVQIGLPDGHGDAAMMPELFQRAQTALDYALYFPKQQVFHYLDVRSMEQKRDRDYRFAVSSVAPSAWTQDLLEVLAQAEREFREQMPSAENVDRSILDILREYGQRLVHSQREQETYSFTVSLREAHTLDEKLELAREQAEDMKASLEWTGKTTHPEIRRVLTYIEEHYAEEITLGDLAEYVSLNENYLSNLFKKEVGEGITGYLNHVRVSKSKALLTDPSVRVYEAAAQVGYRNATYFTTMFRKLTGQSVSEYRKSLS